jgi:hypothetical protein
MRPICPTCGYDARPGRVTCGEPKCNHEYALYRRSSFMLTSELPPTPPPSSGNRKMIGLQKLHPYLIIAALILGPLLGWLLFPDSPVIIFLSFFAFVVVDIAFALLILGLTLWQDWRRSLQSA